MALKAAIRTMVSADKSVRRLALFVFLVALHSLVLGTFIYFFTGTFCTVILLQQVAENLFFVRQVGLFLFCLGLFYGVALTDVLILLRLVPLIISTKLLAVIFLWMNAHLSAWPGLIIATAAVDGLMACCLLGLFFQARCAVGKADSFEWPQL